MGTEQMRKLVASILLFVVAALVIIQQQPKDKVFLSTSETAAQELKLIKNKLHSWSGRLNQFEGAFSSIQRQQLAIKNAEDHLETEETLIRSAVHAARDTVMSLRYKVHDMESDALSNEMFGETKQKPSPSHQSKQSLPAVAKVDATKAHVKHQPSKRPIHDDMSHNIHTHRAALAHVKMHASIAADLRRQAAVAALEVKARKALESADFLRVPVKNSQRTSQRNLQLLSGSEPHSLLAAATRVASADHAVGTAQTVSAKARATAVARARAAALRRIAGFHQELAARPVEQKETNDLEEWQHEVEPADLQRLSLDERAILAEQNAAIAQQQAFHRSDEYHSIVRAAQAAQSPYGPEFPLLPTLPALGPEASG